VSSPVRKTVVPSMIEPGHECDPASAYHGLVAAEQAGREATMETTLDERTSSPAASVETIFSRILVGVDGSPESREAARQSALLLEPDGELTLLAAFGVAPALTGGNGFGIPVYLDLEAQQDVAKGALEAVKAELEGALEPRTLLARDTSWDGLIREAEREHATLIAVGSHGIGRARGIVLGSTTTELVHNAPCSVLVARRANPDFPREIVVGVDGSPESAAAYAVAVRLSERSGTSLRPIVARGGKGVDERLVASIVGHHYEGLDVKPVPALVAAASNADLVVVGSRGLHGLGSLGSVSERVAHRAASSVLIVRNGDSG
jgi:nucleotide-binding universal stress UspA family protein